MEQTRTKKCPPRRQVMYSLLAAPVYRWVKYLHIISHSIHRRFLQILFSHQPYHGCSTDFAVMMAIGRHEAPWKWSDKPYDQILASCCHPSSSDRPSMSDIVARLSAHIPH